MSHHTCINNDGANPSRRCDECDAEQMIKDDMAAWEAGHIVRAALSSPDTAQGPCTSAELRQLAGEMEASLVNNECKASHPDWRYVDGLRQLAEKLETESYDLGRLSAKIEEAINIAARLGPDAFDFIEGRGLHQMRLRLRETVLRLGGQLQVRNAERYRMVLALVEDQKWADLPERIARLRPEPDNPMTKHVTAWHFNEAMDRLLSEAT